jgi:ubiquinone/menaquinone biosynthesis C-methylase UbiE
MPSPRPDDRSIRGREEALRSWLTKGRDPTLQEIDGLDIGWGGVQRWATARMTDLGHGLHLDFACGVGSFLAQLGWRFPEADLIGLNIDFSGPHEPIRQLLSQAEVRCKLVRADARRMPFQDRVFHSVSCFLGLQDIEIGFGEAGIHAALSEASRILRKGGTLTVIDEFPFDKMDRLLKELPFQIAGRGERPVDAHWSRQVAERAIELYADGWVGQKRNSGSRKRALVRAEVLRRMRKEMERQLAVQGYYVPFGPARMVEARKRS